MVGDGPSRQHDAAWIGALALAVRLGVVIWALGRFPPAGDGIYYHQIAERIGAGLGYTWLWPDGVVTYAGHYPVGYPAAVGAIYAVLGPRPWAAMGLNAVLGALAAVAVHRLAARAVGRRKARWAGALVALHPGLVAYTPALMTEGVTAALITCAAAVLVPPPGDSPRAGSGRVVAMGALVGIATLVRPQSLVLAPVFALLSSAPRGSFRRALARMGIVSAMALLV